MLYIPKKNESSCRKLRKIRNENYNCLAELNLIIELLPIYFCFSLLSSKKFLFSLSLQTIVVDPPFLE